MINLTGKDLSLTHFKQIVFDHEKVRLSPQAEKKMSASLQQLLKHLEQEDLIYGVNTGFGALSDKKIPKSSFSALQENIILSHSAGVGPLFSGPEVRAIVLLRANVLARGHSAVRPLVVKTLIHSLNANIRFPIPKKGSVGASGDLAPLSHLALTLIGKGKGRSLLKRAGIKPLRLEAREGIALVNGTQVMAAIGALNILASDDILKLFDVSAAMSLEVVQGSQKAFDSDLHALRPHPGQGVVAKNVWKLLSGSGIQKNHEGCGRVQDPYSFRCIPQVHGSSRDAFLFAKKIIETEINAVTDNPLFFPDKKKWISGGNFHGQYLSQAMDFLAIGLTTLANISERRIEKLLDPKFSHLAPFLSKSAGLSSGLMIAHVTSAALASENKVLSHPASVDTIPTSGNKEDHVSMGVHAALKAQDILENVKNILAIEFLAAYQGLSLLRPLKTSPVLEKVYSALSQKISPIHKDRIFSTDIENIKTLFPKILDVVRNMVQ